jgi:hypothetical protein
VMYKLASQNLLQAKAGTATGSSAPLVVAEWLSCTFSNP